MDSIKEMFQNVEVMPIDLGVLIVYLLVMTSIGVISRKSSVNISDYIRMGCKSTWWVLGLSIFMQMVSAITFTANCSQAYLVGWSSMLLSAGAVIGLLIQATYFAKRMRRTRAVTPMDAVRDRFGPVVEQIKSYTGCLSGTFWGGVMLLGLANFISAIFNIPVPVVTVMVGIVIILYSVSGGSWSVMISDSLQALVMISICFALFILSMKAIGGFDGLLAGIHSAGLTEDYQVFKKMGHVYTSTAGKIGKGFFTPGWLSASLFYGILMAVGLNTSYRYLSVKDDRSASKAALLAAILLAAAQLVFFVPPMVARLLYQQDVEALAAVARPAQISEVVSSADGKPEVSALWKRASLGNSADGAYAVVAKKLLPPGLLGLVLVAMFAATMSSLDSALTGTAGIIAKNIYPPMARLFKRKLMSDKKQLVMTQIINLLLGVWAITLALILAKNAGGGGVFKISMQMMLFLAPIGLPLAVSLLIKRLPSWAPLAGMVTGLMAGGVLQFGNSWGPAWKEILDPLLWHHRMYITLAAGLIPTLLTRFWWNSSPQAYKDQVEAFFEKLRTPVHFENEVGGAEDGIQMKRIGGLGFTVALLLMNLLFFAQDPSGRWTILGVSGSIGIFSLTLFVLGTVRHKKEQSVR